MKWLFFFVFAAVSCTVTKPSVCATEIFMDYQGPVNKPIFPLVFTIQDRYAGFYDGRYVVVVNREEFEMLCKAVTDFKNVDTIHDNADIQYFSIMIADSCRHQSYGTYGRSNSINFLNSLIVITGEFRPEVKATAKDFITVTRNRLGA